VRRRGRRRPDYELQAERCATCCVAGASWRTERPLRVGRRRLGQPAGPGIPRPTSLPRWPSLPHDLQYRVMVIPETTVWRQQRQKGNACRERRTRAAAASTSSASRTRRRCTGALRRFRSPCGAGNMRRAASRPVGASKGSRHGGAAGAAKAAPDARPRLKNRLVTCPLLSPSFPTRYRNQST
jgi:hypothetical protein